MSPRVRVHIDRLVLQGVDPLDAQAFSKGLSTELARVLRNPQGHRGLQHSHQTPVMRIGPLPVTSGHAGARSLGQGIARGIGRGGKS